MLFNIQKSSVECKAILVLDISIHIIIKKVNFHNANSNMFGPKCCLYTFMPL